MDAEMDDMDWPQLQLSHRSKRAESATHTHSWDLQLGKYCPSTPSRIILGKGNPGLLGSPFFFKPEIVLPQQLPLTLPISKALIFFYKYMVKEQRRKFQICNRYNQERKTIFFSYACKSGTRWPHNMQMILSQLGKEVGSEQEALKTEFA